jgi:hypothetical protein
MSVTSKDPRHTIITALRYSTAWIEDADVRSSGDGWVARLHLCPTLAAARAEQQGLRDGSLRAALRDNKLRDLIGGYVVEANARLPRSRQVVAYDFGHQAEVVKAPTDSSE